MVSAVAAGGIITFNCGADPVTITMRATAKVRNDHGPRTVLDGVYTREQAERGKDEYHINCSLCHQDDLSGGGFFGMEQAPPLVGGEFMPGRSDLNNVFKFIRGNMPADNPSTLAPKAVADVLAYILQQNGFPPGMSELPADQAILQQIRIVQKAK